MWISQIEYYGDMEGESQPQIHQKKHIDLRFWRKRDAANKNSTFRETEQYKESENVVLEGISLIKEGKYKEATEYFSNRDTLTRLGFKPYTIQDPGSVRITEMVTSPEQIRFYSDVFAQKSKFSIAEAQIKISQIIDFTNINGKVEHYDIPSDLWKEFALICTEEYLHGLQYLRGGTPLEGLRDDEADVALYMYRKGVDLTDNFLNRYGSRKTAIDQEKSVQNVTNPVSSNPQ